MFNLILGKTVVTSAYAAADLTTDGRVSLSAIDKTGARVRTSATTKGAFDLILGRSDANGGPVILPLNTHALKVTRGDYVAQATFVATMQFSELDIVDEATLVITKKGIPFNERASWTASFPVREVMTGAQVATKIAAEVNKGTKSHGIAATVSSDTVTFTAQKAGDDYTIQGADLLLGLNATVTTAPGIAYGSLEQLKEIASKAAADAGFEYTYQDGADLLYPKYPFNPLAQADAADGGFTVVAIRCGEPRAAKTHDEIVYQTVFVVFATADKAQATTLVTELAKMGEVVSEHVVS